MTATDRTTDTTSDRDALAAELRATVMTNEDLWPRELADVILASDWLAAHDRAVIGRAHAPILALAEKWASWKAVIGEVLDLQPPLRPSLAAADLRAALDPAAVADHERAVQQRTLRDAARQARALPDRSSPNAALDEAEAWATWLDYRADALGSADR